VINIIVVNGDLSFERHPLLVGHYRSTQLTGAEAFIDRMTNKAMTRSLALGVSYGVVTLLVMFSGMPIAFALGAVAVGFMYFAMPGSALDTVTQNVFEEMASITLLSIPLFILKGAAIGKSPAGKDLYSAMHAWMNKIPGGLGIANVFACALLLRCRARAPPPARPSAAPAFRRCASAAIRPASRPASSRPAARWASCCRLRSR
jgi:hypothetical protein